MTETIQRDENVRLADGRRALLSAARISADTYEVMLLAYPNSEEVDSHQCATAEEATAWFRRMRSYYHVPELNGRYKDLADHLADALAYGLERKGDDDGGTCNFDALALKLDGWQQNKVEAAAKAAGLGCFVWKLWKHRLYVFPIQSGVGQGYTRTKAAEAMEQRMKELGYISALYCQMD
nr:hypothetical protein [uncultured Dysosmobacter sp.]